MSQKECVVDDNESSMNEYQIMMNQLVNMKKDIDTIIGKLKQINKEQSKKKKPKTVSGFVKPVQVTNEMSKFLNIDPDQKVSRSYVNKMINQYIKTNDLQLETSKQNFILDDTLATIFSEEKGTQINYFKMQSFLKHNYVK